jgi:hypothetical protein
MSKSGATSRGERGRRIRARLHLKRAVGLWVSDWLVDTECHCSGGASTEREGSIYTERGAATRFTLYKA